MSELTTYPYRLAIIPPKTQGGSYQWAVRMHGKLVQCSDRNFQSEAKAREHAMAQIDKLLSGADDPRPPPSDLATPVWFLGNRVN